MYASERTCRHPDQACVIMANTGERVTYAEFESEANQLTHFLRSDAAVGEEVKALVEPLAGIEPDADLAMELVAYCAENLAGYKCPRSIDFDLDLP